MRPNTPNHGWLANLRDPATAYTALHWAALNGHYEIVQLLVMQDQQLVTGKDKRGCLPLHLAAWNGHHQIVQVCFFFSTYFKHFFDYSFC